jgi:hypothetical protein
VQFSLAAVARSLPPPQAPRKQPGKPLRDAPIGWADVSTGAREPAGGIHGPPQARAADAAEENNADKNNWPIREKRLFAGKTSIEFMALERDRIALSVLRHPCH